MSKLTDISIVVPTFLRKGCLNQCLRGIRVNLPEPEVVVVCDDDQNFETTNFDTWVRLPYDSGLTAKRNAGVKAATNKYVLTVSDDFDFSTKEARDGVEALLEVLEERPEVMVALGRVNNKEYEGNLEVVEGEYIREIRNTWLPYCLKPHPITTVDIGINYFLARLPVLQCLPWDENIRPIGGDHADFFLTLKEHKQRVVWVHDVNVNELACAAQPEGSLYRQMRRRAEATGHKIFLEKRGVKRYIAFDERP